MREVQYQIASPDTPVLRWASLNGGAVSLARDRVNPYA
jgi:hypothetical protein